MMPGNIRPVMALVLVCALVSQCSCASKAYFLKSQGSLSEISPFSSTKTYALSELPIGLNDSQMKLSGVEIATWLYNERTMRSYDISFGVPIPEKVNVEPTVGKQPFKIILHMRSETSGTTFDPLESMLYMKELPEPLSPSMVLLGREKRSYFECEDDTVTGPIFLFYKKDRTTDAAELPMTCLQLQFDMFTPDPSEKFHLKLGPIKTPSGESLQPTIYFAPVTYVDIMH